MASHSIPTTPWRATLLCLTMAAVAACGSTVAGPGRLGGASNQPWSTGGVGLPGGNATTGGTGTSGGSSGGALPVGGVPTSPDGGGGLPTTGGSTGAAGGPRHGPGITPTSIRIGIAYLKNARGQEYLDPGDPRAYFQSMVNLVNSRGGIAGRKLVPVWKELDPDSAETRAQTGQKVCAAFSQDQTVFAAMGTTITARQHDRGVRNCMKKAGAVLGLSSASIAETSSGYAVYPANYDVAAISLDRLCRNLIPALVAGKYFTGWDTVNATPGAAPVKLGIVAPDLPPFRSAIGGVCLPLLKRAGVSPEPDHVHYFLSPNSDDEAPQAVASIQSAVLKFRSAGVTHVIPIDADSQVFFGAQAMSQGYFPRYGVNSAAQTQAYNGITLQPKQLQGAVGLGYTPNADLPPNMYAQSGINTPARRACLSGMRAKGAPMDGATAENTAAEICDLLNYLKLVIERIPRGSAINQANFAASLGSYGAIPSALYPTAFFGRGHLEAVAQAWQWQYFADCQCLHYTGKPYRMT